MKLYDVMVTEHNYGFIQVKANNKEEAKTNAHIEWEQGNAYWNETEVEYIDIKETK